MDILYVIGTRSQCDNFELRCSLRSIAEFGKGVDRVFVVGNCPDWLSDKVIKIPCEDEVEVNDDTLEGAIQKNRNIAKKILYAIDHSDIGEEFLVSMDDHFYVKKVDFNKYPYYVRSHKLISENVNSPHIYTKFMALGAKHLKELGLPTLNFVLHRNMHISRKAVEECRCIMDDCFEKNIPFEIFALINNYRFSKGEITIKSAKDVKIYSGSEWWKTAPECTEVFSTGNFSQKIGLYSLLKGKYNKPSKYEKLNNT